VPQTEENGILFLQSINHQLFMNNLSFNTILSKLGVNSPVLEAFHTEALNLWGVELSGELAHNIWGNLKTELAHINHCPVIISAKEFLQEEFMQNYEWWTEKGIIKSTNYWEDLKKGLNLTNHSPLVISELYDVKRDLMHNYESWTERKLIELLIIGIIL
jgi:hypothetical protein